MRLRKLFNKSAWRKNAKVPFLGDAYFLLVDKCNARCSMCQDDYFRHSGKAITLDKFKTIAENIRLENMKAAILAGGEPLLNKQLFEIISFTNHCYPNIEIVVGTNGIALRKKTAEQLLRRNVHSLSISLNAGTKDTYRKVMQVGCFQKVIENIKYYQDLSLKLGKPSRLNLSFVASRKNIEDLLEFIRLAKSLGVNDLSSAYCRFFPMEKRLSLAINKDSRLEDDDSLYFHQDMSDKYFKEADVLAKRLDINFTREPLFSETISNQKCQFSFTSIMVGFDGEVFPCCGGEVIFKEKVNSGVYDFGNALKQPIESFWHNRYYQALRYSALHPDNPAVPECGVCTNILKWKGHIKKAHIMEWDGLSDKLMDFGLIEHKGH